MLQAAANQGSRISWQILVLRMVGGTAIGVAASDEALSSSKYIIWQEIQLPCGPRRGALLHERPDSAWCPVGFGKPSNQRRATEFSKDAQMQALPATFRPTRKGAAEECRLGKHGDES